MNYKKQTLFSVLLMLNSFSILAVEGEVNEDVQTVEITLEKIMSDPKWISNSPQNAHWLPGSNSIVFEKNKEQGAVKSTLKDTFLLKLDSKKIEEVALDDFYQVKLEDLVYSQDGKQAAYVYEDDIYLIDAIPETNSSEAVEASLETLSVEMSATASSETSDDVEVTDVILDELIDAVSDDSIQIIQLTNTSARESEPQFLHNDVLIYWSGDTIFAIDLTTNLISELIKLEMADAPKAPELADDIIAQEQHELIDYVANSHNKKLERFNQSKEIKENDPRVINSSVYFGEGQRLVNAKLSPKGDRLFVVTRKDVPWRAKGDLMPNYIGSDGRIQFDQVRPRVADAKPNQQNYWLVDVASKQVDKLSISTLPDFDKDVLKSVKIENYREKGEKYKSKKQPRTINLIVDWGWSQGAIQWHDSGEQVAVMLEAWDNKDRWIATVDFKDKKFVPQHQLHDDAWINYTFNDFGWFHDSETLYFLSEQTGYSHIYTKSVDSRSVKQITAGKYESSEIMLTKDDSSFYFRANVSHPGNYQVYRVDSDGSKVKKPTAITNLKGNNSFKMSPDESQLLVTHSNLLTPEELYLVKADGSEDAIKLTNTVSEEFNAMPWTKPEVVEVASSYTDQPIYAKVYYPADYKAGEKRKAVIFNHGAGYLQNSHFGWSGYFREFMFHSMLAQQGYVVMDMDYRASKGYGRDWRTAIYRQMGTPEIQDLKDGVNWLVQNANVDRGRIGTYGGSYGGFMTFMALFNEPELFQAGAALRPVSDWAHYNDGYTSNILNRPEDDMIAYRKSSPIYFAEGLQKPLLINAPMVDNNVFFVDTVRLVQRMIELEKQDFETAIYPVEAHGFKQPSSWLDEYRRIYKLFETNL
ncbi:prolyl oligopeptidase family serine peptidase [uncultured Psychrosphaera sp.]|uniref:S9 family peptidase n=1 Tax=uncultured Psychrosphaera sp. TaxID=1403522 RepID=UPI00261B9DA7|nr:prolyl oligopeptidase family serine peptidase [uncultured Psychrosphaera sp.]